MADLTDWTLTPMIIVGMASSTLIIHHITGWSVPLALIVGLVPGYAVGVCAGLLLAALVEPVLGLVIEIRDKRREK